MKYIYKIVVTVWLITLLFTLILVYLGKKNDKIEMNNKYIIVVIPPYSTPTVTYKKLINDGFQRDSTK